MPAIASSPVYHRLVVAATDAEGLISLLDEDWFPVQTAVGAIDESVLPGRYYVRRWAAGAWSPAYPVEVSQDLRLSLRDLEAGPGCARPSVARKSVVDLLGRTCRALVARESWQDGRRQSEAEHVALCLGGGAVLCWFPDDDPECWEVHWARVAGASRPKDYEFSDMADRVFRCVHTDLASRLGLAGKPLARWAASESGWVAEARLEFADGAAVVFSYDGRSSYTVVRCEPRQGTAEPVAGATRGR
jgi:hypothetical protein